MKTYEMISTTPNQPGPEPEHKPDEPRTPVPTPPEETPFTEPKHYPIHPDIPVQPIHEKDPPVCR